MHNKICTTFWLWSSTEALRMSNIHAWLGLSEHSNWHYTWGHIFTSLLQSWLCLLCRKYKAWHIYFIINSVILIMETPLVTGSYIWTARKALTNCFTSFLYFLVYVVCTHQYLPLWVNIHCEQHMQEWQCALLYIMCTLWISYAGLNLAVQFLIFSLWIEEFHHCSWTFYILAD